MGGLKLDSFKGEIPIADVRVLPDNAATLARNLQTVSGTICGLPLPVTLKATTAGTRKVYRIPINKGVTDDWDASTWCMFQDRNTDIIRTPVINDSFDRYYWASPSQGMRYAPRQALVDGFDGTTARKVGVTAPTVAPTAAFVAGTGALDPANGQNTAKKISRAYVYTWVSIYGEESAPSPPAEVAGPSDGDFLIQGWEPTPADGTAFVAKMRIYRTVTGATGSTTYFKVTDIALGVSAYTDRLTDSVITSNDQIESTSWQKPPDNLEGIALMPNGVMIGWFGNTICFSEPFRPHAWPVEYQQTIEYPIVGVGIFGSSAIVLTKGKPTVVSGVRPSTMSFTTYGTSAPCMSKQSIVNTPEGVFFASENGLMLGSISGLQNITDQLIGREIWKKDYSPSTLNMVYVDGVLYGFWTDSQKGFMFRPRNPDLGLSHLDTVEMGESEPVFGMDVDIWTGRPILVHNNVVKEWVRPSNVTCEWLWKSKEFQLEKPINFGVAQFYWETGVLEFAAYVYLRGNDGSYIKTLVDERTIYTPGKEVRLASGFLSDLWQFEIRGTGQFHKVIVAETIRDLRKV